MWLWCDLSCVYIVFFFFKQKTAYEMRISDWSSDVCSSDLLGRKLIGFDEKTDLVFNKRQKLPYHSNGMRFTAYAADERVLATREYYSVGEIGRASCRERVCQYV